MDSDILTVSTALYWILGVSGTVILLLISTVGYFFKKNQKDRDNHEAKQERNYHRMTEVISQLEKTVNRIDILVDNINRTTEKRLDVHSEKINDHETRIHVLER
jgi:uncharacterized protein YxeA